MATAQEVNYDSGLDSLALGLISMTVATNDDYKIVLFVDLKPQHKCLICGYVLHTPVQTACGHRYGRDCIESLLKESEGRIRCFSGNEDCEEITSDGIYPDFSVKRELRKLKVYCTYKPAGCDVITTWGKLAEHIDACEYQLCMLECPYMFYGCPFRGSDKSLSNHQESTIPFHLELISTYLLDQSLRQSTHRVELERMTTALSDIIERSNASSESVGSVQSLLRYIDRLTPRVELMSKEVEKRVKVLEDTDTTSRASAEVVKTMDSEISNLKSRMNLTEEKIKEQEDEWHNRPTRSRNVTAATSHGPSSELDEDLIRFGQRIKEQDKKVENILKNLLHEEVCSRNGYMIWKIDGYNQKLRDAKNGITPFLNSPICYTRQSGYKLQGRAYLNGTAQGKNTHLSFFMIVRKGDHDALQKWPFLQRVRLTLISPGNRRDTLTKTLEPNPNQKKCYQRPVSAENSEAGFPLFAPNSQVQCSKFLQDDTLFLKIEVDIDDLPF